MLGYFRPSLASLTCAENMLYKAHYCRLCYCLRIDFGQRGRLLVNYDSVVFALILALAAKEKRAVAGHKCYRVSKKCLYEYEDDTAGRRLGALAVSAFAAKCRDNIEDKEHPVLTRVLSAIYSKQLKTLCAKFRDIDIAVQEGIRGTEACKTQGITAILDSWASAMRDFISRVAETDDAYLRLCGSIAKWQYWTDILADFNKDANSGAFNPLRKKEADTFKRLFNEDWTEILRISQQVTGEVVSSLDAIATDEPEYRVLRKIVAGGMRRNTERVFVEQNLIAGGEKLSHRKIKGRKRNKYIYDGT